MVVTPFVEEKDAKDEWIKEFKDECFKASDFIKPRLQIEKLIKERWLEIEEKAKPSEEPEEYIG